jgi:hypothetical protein
MIDRFTVEEINLMCIFDTNSKDALITELTAAIPEFTEPELTDIAGSALIKLEKMTDAEFSMLELYPVYNDYIESDQESEVQPSGD